MGKKAQRRQGYIFYAGPSELNGDDIFCVLTGLVRPASNRKTGPMLQTYIMPAAVSPMVAAVTGADFSVCGPCPLRTEVTLAGKKERPCYECLFQGPRSTWDAAKRGHYGTANALDVAKVISGRTVRLGAWGDPAAIRTGIWKELLSSGSKFSGYTHQHSYCDQELRHYCMASVETPEGRDMAKARDWRTFRVRLPEEPVLPGEVECPASSGRTQCMYCTLCNGLRSGRKHPDVTIVVHGQGAKSFRSRIHII